MPLKQRDIDDVRALASPPNSKPSCFQFTARPLSFLKLFTYITGLACACACLAMLFTFGAWLHSYKAWLHSYKAQRAARASRASSTASGAPSPHGVPAAYAAQPAFELSEKDASLVRALRVGLRVISALVLLARSLGENARLPLCVLSCFRLTRVPFFFFSQWASSSRSLRTVCLTCWRRSLSASRHRATSWACSSAGW